MPSQNGIGSAGAGLTAAPATDAILEGSRPEDGVRAEPDGDRALRRLAEGETGDPERRRLLLNASRVGQHELRPRLEAEKVEVSERLDQHESAVVELPCGMLLDPVTGAWMDREDDGNVRPSSWSWSIVSRSRSGSSTSAGRWSVTSA